MKQIIRPADVDDCGKIAELYSVASDGVADYVWSKLAEPGEKLLDVGRRRYRREDTPFSYRNCTVVEMDGEVAGMLVAFPMHCDPGEIESDPVLRPYSDLEQDNSFYICGVALYPDYRGRGIGSGLMVLAEEQARERDFDQTSLIVFEQNTGALRLYRRLGYREMRRAAVVPHPLIHHSGDALLMVKDL